MPRIALYVSQPTVVAINPTDPADRASDLERYPTRDSAGKADGSVTLSSGIYLIRANAAVQVTGQHAQSEISINDKDAWPDPPQALIEAIVPGITGESLREFFRIAKSADGPLR